VARTQPLLLGLAPVPNPVVYLPEAKPLFELFRGLAGLCSLVGVAGAIAALVVRFRRSRGIERQQLKWFTYAAVLAPLPALVYELAPSLFGLLQTLVFPLVPISVGIAILRYRLYEIDQIINRTLVYGLLTVILGLSYAAGSGVCAGSRYWHESAELAGRRRNPGRGGDLSPGSAGYPGRGGSPLQPPQVQRRPDHSGVLHPPARPGRPRHPLQRAAGGRRPDHGADPSLAVASTSPTRLPGHSSPCATADSLGLLSTTAGLYL
jgi:hypothetical protein